MYKANAFQHRRIYGIRKRYFDGLTYTYGILRIRGYVEKRHSRKIIILQALTRYADVYKYKRGRPLERIRHSPLHRLFSTRTGRPSLLHDYRGHAFAHAPRTRWKELCRHEYALVSVVNTNTECSLPKIITRGRWCDFRPPLPRLS